MNKTEKLISALLGVALVLCFMYGPMRKGAPQQDASAETAAAATGETAAVEAAASDAAAATNLQAVVDSEPAVVPEVAVPSKPEEIAVLENDFLKLELSSWGGVVKKATFKKFAVGPGEISEGNPAFSMDYSESPLGAIEGVEGAGLNASFDVSAATPTSVVFSAGGVVRTYSLAGDYSLELAETFADGSRPSGRNALSIGMMTRGDGKTDFVSVDSWQSDPKGGDVVHHDDDDTAVKPLLGGMGGGGGCGGCAPSKVQPGTPAVSSAAVAAPQRWVALKDRFFVTALAACTQPNAGFTASVRRDTTTDFYKPVSVATTVAFEGGVAERTTKFYIGPKEQSRLADLGMRDVMEFGIWRWICYPIVWLLNACHSVIPSYGVAIILLTILVRLVFWPLTRKSTEGMKKMQEIQPLIKEIQAKYKDNPQRLQQETFALYRQKKVNPMSSCLPMLIQIPVFIALFNVLRSAVELRYASFLWIPDLSEPERLLADVAPFSSVGGLNILPLLMAATMYLQSRLTPSAGDPKQQRMMTVFMPIMMLVMFYSFASALSLYWTLSQVMSIIQMWMIRRDTERRQAAAAPVEVIDPPTPTRQQRRHGA